MKIASFINSGCYFITLHYFPFIWKELQQSNELPNFWIRIVQKYSNNNEIYWKQNTSRYTFSKIISVRGVRKYSDTT